MENENIALGKNSKIGKNVEIVGKCVIGENSLVTGCCRLENVKIGSNTKIESSVLENCEVGSFCSLGAFCHLRGGCKIGDHVKIGSFVEVKNSTIGNGSKLPHLCYVGDSQIGKNCNIGCGVIFANYNGSKKMHSILGDNVFVGSNCNIVAPVTIASGTYICAGTTVTCDTQENDFVIGRVRQENHHRETSYWQK